MSIFNKYYFVARILKKSAYNALISNRINILNWNCERTTVFPIIAPQEFLDPRPRNLGLLLLMGAIYKL